MTPALTILAAGPELAEPVAAGFDARFERNRDAGNSSRSNAEPRSSAVRVTGGGSWPITAESSGSTVSLAWQHGQVTTTGCPVATLSTP